MEKIIALKGPDRVRKRPEVIFRSSGVEGACAAINEILKNSVKEAQQGFGKKISICRFKDSSIEITDYGLIVKPYYCRGVSFIYKFSLRFCHRSILSYLLLCHCFLHNYLLFHILWLVQCPSLYLQRHLPH